MAGSDVHPIHRFEPWQVWPGSYDNPAPDGSYPSPGNSGLEISRATPIASMGSCFAREIKTVLLREGFSYITEESDHPASKHASAAWERLYNLFSMRQIFGSTFEEWTPALRWWQAPLSGKIQDPFRRIILYENFKEAEADFRHHRICSRKALERAGGAHSDSRLDGNLGGWLGWIGHLPPFRPLCQRRRRHEPLYVPGEQACREPRESGTHSCNHRPFITRHVN